VADDGAIVTATVTGYTAFNGGNEPLTFVDNEDTIIADTKPVIT